MPSRQSAPQRDEAVPAFVLLSFEGPDSYARAGGLGARVSGLAVALADAGYETHLFFIGSAEAAGHEVRCGGSLHLHRWCQWISKYHPGGVYDGEEGNSTTGTHRCRRGLNSICCHVSRRQASRSP
jgi:hypothetical protein